MNPDSPTTVQTSDNQNAKRPKMKLATLLTIIVVVLGVAAAYLITTRNNGNPQQNALQVNITKNSFDPSTITIKAGSSVTWVNTDTAPHRVASNPFPENDGLAGFDSKNPLGPNGTYTFKFDKTGTFDYHDQYHPTVNGSVTVIN